MHDGVTIVLTRDVPEADRLRVLRWLEHVAEQVSEEFEERARGEAFAWSAYRPPERAGMAVPLGGRTLRSGHRDDGG